MNWDERTALDYLEGKGIREVHNGIFIGPEKSADWSEKTWSAVQYLCDEWDFAVVSKEEVEDLARRIRKHE